MNEEEWLNSWKYWRIYDAIRNRGSTRKLRLLMAACCRLMSHRFFDARLERALEATDRCADDPTAEAVAEKVDWEMTTSPDHPALPQEGWAGELAAAILGARQLLDDAWENSPDAASDQRFRSHWKQYLAHAVYMSLRDKPGSTFTGGTGDAAEYCAVHLNIADAILQGYELYPGSYYQWDFENLNEQNPEFPRGIANLLRDIFGNPFRPVTFDPNWRTSDVVAMSRGMYEMHDFAAMPILADALQDAGCENAAVLDHCRDQQGVHVRGCWVVDLVLGLT